MPIYTYTTFDDPSSDGRTAAHAVNGMDQIVGTYINGTGHHGFFYNFNSNTYTTLDDPSAIGLDTDAFSINGAGQIVGQAVSCEQYPQANSLLTGKITGISQKLALHRDFRV